MREQMTAWIAAHSFELATVGVAAVVAWMLVRVAGELLVWRRARRQAAGGCSGCDATATVVAYPDGTSPVPRCWPCLDGLHKAQEVAGHEPSPWVPTARPDWWGLVSPVLLAVLLTLVAVAAAAALGGAAA